MRPPALLLACLLAFWLTLAATIGLRQPEETRLIAVGVLIGVAAGVPTSLLLSGAATRAVLARYQAAPPPEPEPDPEPEIVILPAAPAAAPAPARRPPPPAPPRPTDSVTLIGGDERDD